MASPNIENLRVIASYFKATIDELIESDQIEYKGSNEKCLGNKNKIVKKVHLFSFQISLILFDISILIFLNGFQQGNLIGTILFFSYYQ